jgi:hypothetical protein
MVASPAGPSAGMQEEESGQLRNFDAEAPVIKTPVGKVLPRSPITVLRRGTRSVSIEELAKEFPHIEPPSDPVLCISCSGISLDALEKSGKLKREDPVTGQTTTTSGTWGDGMKRLTITWDFPNESFKGCPMCKLLACNQVWKSGLSPYNRHFKENGGSMELQFELSLGIEVELFAPAQAGLAKDSGKVEIFSLHSKLIPFQYHTS